MKSLQKYITIYVKYENSDYLICFFRFKCVFFCKILPVGLEILQIKI